ncbi:hypothetical protein FIV42_28515 [Persicimonas caeni]|uniref:Uncharacterized protein n=2 Tax=Persicimonas caeni TaxID=2292766 RepID=A0A4Y6Q1V2_PERCE|nr:hypothetical protein [Persicimonas caeni]QDG54546.1 hypothetical protein FIV42_28515 [Persicimonas caeni]QED35767.1 hypothetical protein FRD00_28510 [Persicimonas caeni]
MLLTAAICAVSAHVFCPPAQARPPLRAGQAFEVGEAKSIPFLRPALSLDMACADDGTCAVISSGYPDELHYGVLRRNPAEQVVEPSFLGNLPDPRDPVASVSLVEDQFVVAWCDENGSVWSQEISVDDGAAQGTPTEVFAVDGVGPSTACSKPLVSKAGAGYVVVWEYSGVAGRIVRARWIDDAGAPESEVADVLTSQQALHLHAVDFDGSQVVVLGEADDGYVHLRGDPLTKSFASTPTPLPAMSPTWTGISQACSANGSCRLGWAEETGDGHHKVFVGAVEADGQWSHSPLEAFSFEAAADIFYDYGSFMGRVRLLAHGDSFLVVVTGRTRASPLQADIALDGRFRRLAADDTLGVSHTLELTNHGYHAVDAIDHDGAGLRSVQRDNLFARDAHLASTGEMLDELPIYTYMPNTIRQVAFFELGDAPLLTWAEANHPAYAAAFGTTLSATGAPVVRDGLGFPDEASGEDRVECDRDNETYVAWSRKSERRLDVVHFYDCVAGLQARTLEVVDRVEGELRFFDVARSEHVGVAAYLAPHSTDTVILVFALRDGDQVRRAVVDDVYDPDVRIACTDTYCVVAQHGQQGRHNVQSVVQFSTFMLSDAFSPPSHPWTFREHLARHMVEADSIDAFELGVTEEGVTTMWRESSDAPDGGLWRLGTVTEDGDFQTLTTYDADTIARLGVPKQAHGRRAMLATLRVGATSNVTGVVRLDSRWQLLDDAPLAPVVDGSQRPVDAFAIRDQGGFFVAYSGVAASPQRTRAPLYVQAIGLPGEAGEVCRLDVDCASRSCANGVCQSPRAVDAGPGRPGFGNPDVGNPLDTAGGDANDARVEERRGRGVMTSSGCMCRHSQPDPGPGAPVTLLGVLAAFALRRRYSLHIGAK